MIEIDRKFLKNDPVFNHLFNVVKSNHKVAEHTEKVLLENKEIKNFCEEARHFAIIPGTPPLHIHYDVASWYHPDGALVKIESIGVYMDFIEYEVARLRGLHSGALADIPNIN